MVEALFPCVKSVNAFPHQQKLYRAETLRAWGIFLVLFYSEQKHFPKFVRIEVMRDENSNTGLPLLKYKTFDTITQTHRI